MDLQKSGMEGGGHEMDWSGSEQGQAVSISESGNEYSGSIKCEPVLLYPRTC